MYATTKKLRKKAFKEKGENIKQTRDIQISFLLEIKRQTYRCLQVMTIFYRLMCPFSTTVWIGMCIGMPQR